jgi:hypothetical protein
LKSGLHGSEALYNEVLPLFLLALSAAAAVMSVIAVLLVSVVPDWFVDPQGALFSVAILGAVVLLLWSFAVFWRQVLILRLKQGEIKHEAEHIGTKTAFEPVAKQVLQSSKSILVSPSVDALTRSGESTAIVTRNIGSVESWIRERVPDARNMAIASLLQPSDSEWIEYRGTVQDAVLLAYHFNVRVNHKDGKVDDKRSWIK